MNNSCDTSWCNISYLYLSNILSYFPPWPKTDGLLLAWQIYLLIILLVHKGSYEDTWSLIPLPPLDLSIKNPFLNNHAPLLCIMSVSSYKWLTNMWQTWLYQMGLFVTPWFLLCAIPLSLFTQLTVFCHTWVLWI